MHAQGRIFSGESHLLKSILYSFSPYAAQPAPTSSCAMQPHEVPRQDIPRHPAMAKRQAPMQPSRLIELLTEAPSRTAAIPSKYDEVLSYLISDYQPQAIQSNTSPDYTFEPEDEATLFGSLGFQ